MQDHRRAPYPERRIETRVTNFPNRRLSHQRNDNSALVVIKLGGLHYDDKGYRILVLADIPMHIELRH
jgi:hypothetical protein